MVSFKQVGSVVKVVFVSLHSQERRKVKVCIQMKTKASENGDQDRIFDILAVII